MAGSMHAAVWERVCRHTDGLAIGSTVAALEGREAFGLLRGDGRATMRRLLAETGGRPGYLHVAVRLLASQGWLTREGEPGTDELGLTLTPEGVAATSLAPCYATAVTLLGQLRGLEAVLRGARPDDHPAVDVLDAFRRRIAEGWGLPPGPVHGRGRPSGASSPHGARDGPAHVDTRPARVVAGRDNGERAPVLDRRRAGSVVSGLLATQSWAESRDGRATLTEAGQLAASMARQYWYPVSYLETILSVPDLLFGELPGGARGGGEERHLDRGLDIRFSGGVFTKTCREPFLEVVLPVFDREPLSDQPTGVVDTGCGEGSLLAALYAAIRDRTAPRPRAG